MLLKAFYKGDITSLAYRRISWQDVCTTQNVLGALRVNCFSAGALSIRSAPFTGTANTIVMAAGETFHNAYKRYRGQLRQSLYAEKGPAFVLETLFR